MNFVGPVKSTADVTMTVASPIQHLCPFVDEVDEGVVTVTWRVSGTTFELHSLRAYFNAYADSEMSHEAVTDRIRHDLSVTQGLDVISVETAWTTAGMEVTCSTSPTPAALT